MPWHDPARLNEPESDAALRDELRALLGMQPRGALVFECEPTPELVALADELRKEAFRRRHTTRKRGSWMLMAAALPFALTLGGLGAWGLSQKHRADNLATTVHEKDTLIQRLAADPSRRAPEVVATPARDLRGGDQKLVAVPKSQPAKGKAKELVIPVEHPDRLPESLMGGTQQVKGH
jgi:hypothetical protein